MGSVINLKVASEEEKNMLKKLSTGVLEKGERIRKSGLQVLMTDNQSIPESERPKYGEYDDPVSDRDMVSR